MRPVYLTSGDLALLWKIPAGTVRRWASEDNWRRTHTRPVRFDVADAQAGYDRRRSVRSPTEIRERENGGVTLVHNGYKVPFADAEWEAFTARVKAGEFDRRSCVA